MAITLRDYQLDAVDKGAEILRKYGILYLAMEVRTGKTLTALSICESFKNVLFLTKKMAIPSIESDYKAGKFEKYFKLTVTNYESIHKLPNEVFDVIIIDESHGTGSFPLPNKRAKDIKELVAKNKCSTIHLSGTPNPESYSQIYHQLWVNPRTPFAEWKNFYSFAKKFVTIVDKRIANGRMIKDYSGARKQEVLPIYSHLLVVCSQQDAGFETKINEEILTVRMKDSTYNTANRLIKDLVIDERVIADTPVKLQQKLHQIYSGTIKFTDGTRKVFDTSKAEFIRDRFAGKKIAIFYKFIAEYDCLKQIFGEKLCNDIETFNNTDCNIALQIVSGREGTKLSKADALVFYNIDFSATSYWQARDRMSTIDRKHNQVYWIFAEGGIEFKVHAAVVGKKSYTNNYFKKDYGIGNRYKQLNLL